MSSLGQEYIDDTRGHEWKLDEEGKVDILGYNPGCPHNGPVCVKCGYGFCHHCHELPVIECPKTPKRFKVIK